MDKLLIARMTVGVSDVIINMDVLYDHCRKNTDRFLKESIHGVFLMRDVGRPVIKVCTLDGDLNFDNDDIEILKLPEKLHARETYTRDTNYKTGYYQAMDQIRSPEKSTLSLYVEKGHTLEMIYDRFGDGYQFPLVDYFVREV
jgi:hypothetical protein